MSLYQVPAAETFGGNDLPFWAHNGMATALALIIDGVLAIVQHATAPSGLAVARTKRLRARST